MELVSLDSENFQFLAFSGPRSLLDPILDHPKTTNSAKKGLQNKWTPISTHKIMLGRVNASKIGKSSILKYSTKKMRARKCLCYVRPWIGWWSIKEKMKCKFWVFNSFMILEILVLYFLQKVMGWKILTRLRGHGIMLPTCCTHFVIEKFARTRNMLEIMVACKRIVTH